VLAREEVINFAGSYLLETSTLDYDGLQLRPPSEPQHTYEFGGGNTVSKFVLPHTGKDRRKRRHTSKGLMVLLVRDGEGHKEVERRKTTSILLVCPREQTWKPMMLAFERVIELGG
jgi:hypothetical protein